jgi:cytidyltransferase-like protein
MKIVYTFGAWDILHKGHLNFLKKARSLGDSLVVGVQSDKAIEECKPETSAIVQEQRLILVENLKYVDKAELYDFDYLDKFKKSGANVLCMSESHKNTERLKELYDYVRTNYGDEAVIFLPYDMSISSSNIKKEIRNNSWSNIWEKVAATSKADYEICGYSNEEDVKKMASYIRDKVDIKTSDRILDYGCGSGVILKNLKLSPGSIGVDSSSSMIVRARKNNPEHIFFVSRRPSIMCDLDCVISWGVFQYLEDYGNAEIVIKDMLNLSNNILIMEIPDMSKKKQREEHRNELGMNPFPPHLYYSKEFFTRFGFCCYDNDIFLTKNSKFSFTAIRSII